jgi:hypothetical protein
MAGAAAARQQLPQLRKESEQNILTARCLVAEARLLRSETRRIRGGL